MVVGIFVFILADIEFLKMFPTVQSALISLGVFLVGLGEWITHPMRCANRK